MKKNKLSQMTAAGVATGVILAHGQVVKAETPTVDWGSVNYQPYLKNDGNGFYDPANEPGISPDDVDFVSGFSKGAGDKASFYVGSDGVNLFFRMRLLDSPYDRKGGFLSSVWFVQLVEQGQHKATVGIYGKSPHEDYIYVANPTASVVNQINSTDASGSIVPGTRIIEAENGQYFLDFQVPISKITEVAPSITSNSNVQFFFGTSKSGNLSVINKDYMGSNDSSSLTDGASVKFSPTLNIQIPTINVTSPTGFDTNMPTFTGTTTNAADNSKVTVTINNETYESSVTGGSWSIPTNSSLANGTYETIVKVVNEVGNIAAFKQNVRIGNPISIDGGEEIFVSSFPSTVSGTFSNESGGSKKVKYEVKDSNGVIKYSSKSIQTNTDQTWSEAVSLSLPEGTYTIEATEDVKNGSNLPVATQTVVIDQQIDVAISSPANGASSTNTTPTINGTTDPNADVEVYIDNVYYRKTTADENGNWSLEISKALPVGNHTITAKAIDAIGNTLDTSINYEVTAMNITITNGSNVSLNDDKPTIKGRSTAPDDSLVTVQVGDVETLTTTVVNGKWSVDVSQPLAEGLHVLSATVTSGSLSAQATQNLTVDANTFVTVDTPEEGSVTENKRESISGMAEANSTIVININDGYLFDYLQAGSSGSWLYTPTKDLLVGKQRVKVLATDQSGNDASTFFTFIVNTPGNRPPTITGNNKSTMESQPVSGLVEGFDPDNDPITFSKETEPGNGSATVDPDGTWTYTPNDGYVGTDSFKITVSDGKGGLATTTVEITVNGANKAPTVQAKYEEVTNVNTGVNGKVVAEDQDGDPLTYSKESGPLNGSATVNEDGTWTYTPADGFVGTDSFTIMVTDGKGGLATTTVEITVNRVPTVQAKYEEVTNVNTGVSGKVVAEDQDGDALTYSKESGPAFGTATVNEDGTWTYTPDADYVGTDSFTITISDGKGGVASTTVEITVNRVPTVQAKYEEVTNVNTGVSGKVVAEDQDGDALTYSKESGPAFGTATVNEDGTWTYTPDADYVGTDSFTITVSDGKGGLATTTVEITVNGANKAPTVQAKYEEVTNVNTGVSGQVVAEDLDGDALTYSKESGPAFGTATVNEDGTWTYTPDADYVGTDSFTITISDGKGGVTSTTVEITVNEVNEVPTVQETYTVVTNENKIVTGVVEGTDPDGDPLTYSKESDPVNGTATVNSDGTWTYTPDADYVGTDSFTITVSDGKGGVTTTTVEITVNEVNEVPTVQETYTVVTDENSIVTGVVEGTDPDGDPLTYSKESDPVNGTATVNSDGTWTYTPDADYVGTDSFTITVSDGKGGVTRTTVEITVNEVNEVPTVKETYTVVTDENKEVSGQVVAEDIDGDSLTYSKESNPGNGTATVNSDGTWTYTPDADYVGTDSFTITVSDGKGGVTSTTVEITVNEVNEAPTVKEMYTVVTDENKEVSGQVVAEDLDGDSLTYTKESNPGNGTATVNSDGTWTYTPDADYVGTDSFTITVSDGKGGVTSTTVEITVNEVNEAPTVKEMYTVVTDENKEVSGQVVAEDLDGDSLTYTKESNPGNGTAIVNEDGTWTYTPNADYVGTDSFTITVSDGKGGVATTTIEITVNEVNEAPTVKETYTVVTDENKEVSGKVAADDPDGDPLTYSKKSDPVYGRAIVNEDGTWTYTPDAGYVGTDSFTITVSDGKGGLATTTVKIDVKESDTAISFSKGEYYKTSDATPLITGSAKGPSGYKVEIKILDSNGNLVETGVSRLLNGQWNYQINTPLQSQSYQAVAILKNKENKELMRSTQSLEIELTKLGLKLTSSHTSIVGDGKTKVFLTAVIRDENGKPISGEKVSFHTQAGRLVNSEAITNSKGEAVVELISPDLSGTLETQAKKITATVSNPDKGLYGESHMVVNFTPATVSGVIIDSATNLPISGATVEINEDFNNDGTIDFSEFVLTDANGAYKIAVPYPNWTYELQVTTNSSIGGYSYLLEYSLQAKVGEIKGVGEDIKTEKGVSGQLFMLSPSTNIPERISSMLPNVEIKPNILNDPSGTLRVSVDQSGRYNITGGEKGQTYDVMFNFEVTDDKGNKKKLIGKKVTITVPEDGVSTVDAGLVDPYGIVTDDQTGLPIKDVTMKLYWADTELNRSKGRTPHTLVNLPILEGFAPNDNRVPQMTTKAGAYAWMVFPDGDYYIIAEKDGYLTYDSRTEGRNVSVKPGEDSYIENGIIHVGQSIVEYDLSMTKIKKDETMNQVPTTSDYQYKIQIDNVLKEKIQATDPEGDLLTYRMLASPENGTLQLNSNGEFIYTPLPGYKGTDRFTIEISDEHGGKAASNVNVIIEESEADKDISQLLIETFVNKTITGKLKDLNVVNPYSLEVKAPKFGEVDVDLATLTWKYKPKESYVGEDQFIIMYYDDKGVLYTRNIDVQIHDQPVSVQPKPNTPSSDGLKELPNTGSLFDRSILLSLASLFGAAGLVLRRLGKRRENS
ncbi:Ig-like domain-containing protein [Bacillus sp. SCS-153A]|uniref:Ig-like domain-containing protein n=1 Tax=Rossellomorea sedimentorum TaxID=3115294 RepID=UPI003905DD78